MLLHSSMSNSQLRNIVLLGKVGHGKTRLLNNLTSSTYESSAGAASCTRQLQTGQIPDSNLVIVDTPGFYNSEDVTQHINAQTSAFRRPISGVYVVIRYGAPSEMAEVANRMMDFVDEDDIRVIVTHVDTVRRELGFDEVQIVTELSDLLDIPKNNIALVGKDTHASEIKSFIFKTVHEPKTFKISDEQRSVVRSLSVGSRKFNQEIDALANVMDDASQALMTLSKLSSCPLKKFAMQLLMEKGGDLLEESCRKIESRAKELLPFEQQAVITRLGKMKRQCLSDFREKHRMSKRLKRSQQGQSPRDIEAAVYSFLISYCGSCEDTRAPDRPGTSSNQCGWSLKNNAPSLTDTPASAPSSLDEFGRDSSEIPSTMLNSSEYSNDFSGNSPASHSCKISTNQHSWQVKTSTRVNEADKGFPDISSKAAPGCDPPGAGSFSHRRASNRQAWGAENSTQASGWAGASNSSPTAWNANEPSNDIAGTDHGGYSHIKSSNQNARRPEALAPVHRHGARLSNTSSMVVPLSAHSRESSLSRSGHFSQENRRTEKSTQFCGHRGGLSPTSSTAPSASELSMGTSITGPGSYSYNIMNCTPSISIQDPVFPTQADFDLQRSGETEQPSQTAVRSLQSLGYSQPQDSFDMELDDDYWGSVFLEQTDEH